MERLTFEGNFCDIAQCTDTPGGSWCESGACSQRKTWERLKAIEDILGDDYDLDRLREALERQSEYEAFMKDWEVLAEIAGAVRKAGAKRAAELVEADRDGRCVVLPCKVGDDVWLIVTKHPRVAMPEFSFVKHSRLTWTKIERVVKEFGKTVFLTREEAQAALERMKSNG